MPYRISKTIEIENGHMLSKHPDKCQFPHGHTRKVEFVLEAAELDGNEMVCDFKIIKSAISEYLDRFDHAMCMNTDDPAFQEFKARYGDRVIGFEQADPTTEVLARFMFDACKSKLAVWEPTDASPYKIASGVKLAKVRVSETTSSWAEYWE